MKKFIMLFIMLAFIFAAVSCNNDGPKGFDVNSTQWKDGFKKLIYEKTAPSNSIMHKGNSLPDGFKMCVKMTQKVGGETVIKDAYFKEIITPAWTAQYTEEGKDIKISGIEGTDSYEAFPGIYLEEKRGNEWYYTFNKEPNVGLVKTNFDEWRSYNSIGSEEFAMYDSFMEIMDFLKEETVYDKAKDRRANGAYKVKLYMNVNGSPSLEPTADDPEGVELKIRFSEEHEIEYLELAEKYKEENVLYEMKAKIDIEYLPSVPKFDWWPETDN